MQNENELIDFFLIIIKILEFFKNVKYVIKKTKQSFFADNMALYLDNSRETTDYTRK